MEAAEEWEGIGKVCLESSKGCVGDNPRDFYGACHISLGPVSEWLNNEAWSCDESVIRGIEVEFSVEVEP